MLRAIFLVSRHGQALVTGHAKRIELADHISEDDCALSGPSKSWIKVKNPKAAAMRVL